MASVLDSLLDTVVTKIRDLALPGMPNASIKRLKCILDRDLPTPAIGVAIYGPEEISETGPNQKEDVIYNIAVAIKVADNQDQLKDNDGETQFRWRERIRRRFSNQRGTDFPFKAISEATTSTVRPLKVIDEQIWAADNLLLSALVIRVQCREGRSFTA